MWKETRELAVNNGFKEVSDRLRRISPGLVELIYVREDGKIVLECISISHDGKRDATVSEINTFEEAANAANGGPIGITSRDGSRTDWGSILKKMDPEHWRRASDIANRYTLPQLGGLEHDRRVIGKDDADVPADRIIGKTFWQRSLPDDQKNGGKKGG